MARGELRRPVAAEDVLLFVNAAVTATGQREFRSGAGEQRLSLDFLHEYVRVNYRSGVRRRARPGHQRPQRGADRAPPPGERGRGERRGQAHRGAADRGPARGAPAAAGVPADARAAGGEGQQPAHPRHLPRLARGPPGPGVRRGEVPRRTEVRSPARSICPYAGEELGDFLFRPGRRPRYEHPLLDAHRRAHYEQAALYELPFTVAEGFAARHGVPREVFLERIAPRATRLERLRIQSRAGAARRRPGRPCR